MMNLVFASSNINKITEIQGMLPQFIKVRSLDDIGCHEEIPETADTIEGNAILKANYITEKYGCDCFADDSGLEVEALGGAPGVYSARYAGPQRNNDDNINKLLVELNLAENRKARFVTVIALNLKGEQHIFRGEVSGHITNKPSGSKGFGYDPVFIPDGYDITFAQMPPEQKAAISHRGEAVRKLIDFLKK